jgi:UDPglucose--hexose-1-phosphate uridylyltransferase
MAEHRAINSLPGPELRWNPLRGEWVIVSAQRQDRTFLPPTDACPLCPTRTGGIKTEIPEPEFDIVVFQNRFPSLVPDDVEITAGTELTPTEMAKGFCEVVVYTQDHYSSLANESAERIEHLLRVWTHRYKELGSQSFVKYVFVFENKGEVIGVTLPHPHGQIYAYPFVPPVPAKELQQSLKYMELTGRCVMCDIIRQEVTEQSRIVVRNDCFVAYVPKFAAWPYELHISPLRHFQSLTDISAAERIDLAAVLKACLLAFDRLFGKSLPYIMALHQRPTDGQPHASFHFHIEFYTPLRTATKQKYMAGSEVGAGVFINDRLPEESAAALRSHIASV